MPHALEHLLLTGEAGVVGVDRVEAVIERERLGWSSSENEINFLLLFLVVCFIET